MQALLLLAINGNNSVRTQSNSAVDISAGPDLLDLLDLLDPLDPRIYFWIVSDRVQNESFGYL